MVRTRYAPDRGLQARMGLTMFLLGLVFVAFVTALVFVLIALKQGAGAIIFFAVILGVVLAFGSLFWSDKVALRASGAQEVTPQQAPQLHGIIDRTVRAGRHAQATGRDRADRHAERVRYGAQQQERGACRDHGADEAAG